MEWRVLDDVGSRVGVPGLDCSSGRGIVRCLGTCMGQGGAGLRDYVVLGVVSTSDGLIPTKRAHQLVPIASRTERSEETIVGQQIRDGDLSFEF